MIPFKQILLLSLRMRIAMLNTLGMVEIINRGSERDPRAAEVIQRLAGVGASKPGEQQAAFLGISLLTWGRNNGSSGCR